jgi:UDP-N-acetylglucosamine--N-acetylmuramyl-(pentapeptide) pyrophosphoryl-undecaprenol N-acetylglucosamine transferase
VLFIGSDRGLESRLVPDAGFDLEALRSRQVMGRGALGRIAGALSIVAASLRSLGVLGRFRPDVVISVGGYAAMPAGLAAVLRRIPLVLVEPNAVPGRVNRLLARFARRVFVGFEVAGRTLDPQWRPDAGADSRVRCVGIPLRARLVDAFSGGAARRVPSPPIRLLIFGGSQGARQINEAVMDALPRLATLSLEIVHQTGEADRKRVTEAFAAAGVEAEVIAFEPDMPSRYVWADLAVCRSGALTVAELALAGLPALLVPYPYAADDHQAANAAELERAGAARRLDARTLDGTVLADTVGELVGRPDLLERMARAASGLGRPHAARDIVDACAALLEGRS